MSFEKGHIPWNKDLKGRQPWHNIIGLVNFPKGYTPHNKGKKFMTSGTFYKGMDCKICSKPLTRRQLQVNKKPQYCSYICKYKGMKNFIPWNKGIKTGITPWLGKTRSEETIKKMSLAHKKSGHMPPKDIRATGEKHWKWKGGISRYFKTGYWGAEYKRWRTSVFERDNYTCRECSFHGSRGYITAHHIKSQSNYPKLRFNINNGLTLCEPCHSKTDNYKGRALSWR